jgi:hypothetical protein
MHRGSTIKAISAAIVGLSAPGAFAGAIADRSASGDTAAKQQPVMEAGAQAVIYGLPLVLMEITMRKTTNVAPGHSLARRVNAIWSVTWYDSQWFFVDKPINRHAIRSWMPTRRDGDSPVDL